MWIRVYHEALPINNRKNIDSTYAEKFISANVVIGLMASEEVRYTLHKNSNGGGC